MLFIICFVIMYYVVKWFDLEWIVWDLFKVIGDGILDVNINYEYVLKDVVKVYEVIEFGKILGVMVLIL